MKKKQSSEPNFKRTEKFWAKVDRNPTATGCWMWAASLNSEGYGSFCGTGAHRYSYAIARGTIPEGMFVLHTCDNRRCVNPAHLAAGTHAENMADRDAKAMLERVGLIRRRPPSPSRHKERDRRKPQAGAPFWDAWPTEVL